MLYDLIIIGAGPAGLAAAIYAKRALLKTLVFEKELAGGKLRKTADVENYPGFTKISGPGLAEEITKHVLSYNIELKEGEEVTQLIKNSQELFEIKTKNATYFSKAVIVASGTVENKLKVAGEEEFNNFGVSYCAICDGKLFEGQIVAVVGGGYSACEAALYLSNIAEKVYLIHRREKFRIDQEIERQVRQDTRIELILNTVVSEIGGEEGEQKKVNYLILKNLKESQEKTLKISALFPCIGLLPYTNFLHSLSVCDKKNYVLVNEKCATAIPGLFAAGDIIKPERIRQIVTATSDGAIAAQAVTEYLKRVKS